MQAGVSSTHRERNNNNLATERKFSSAKKEYFNSKISHRSGMNISGPSLSIGDKE